MAVPIGNDQECNEDDDRSRQTRSGSTGPEAGNPGVLGLEAPAAPRALTPEARRALAEAEERRRRAAQNETTAAKEIGGREGPDPIRYGDWEKGGIASDF